TSCRKPAWRPRVWPRIRGWASGPRAAHKQASTSTAFLQTKDTPDDEAVRADHVVIIRRFCASRGSRGIFAAANRSPPPLLLGFPLHRGAAQPVSPRAMSLLEVAAMRPVRAAWLSRPTAHTPPRSAASFSYPPHLSFGRRGCEFPPRDGASVLTACGKSIGLRYAVRTLLGHSGDMFLKLLTDAGRGHADLARIGLRVDDELGNRLGRNRRVNHQDGGTSEDARDRRNVADEIEIELVVERRVGRVHRTA